MNGSDWIEIKRYDTVADDILEMEWNDVEDKFNTYRTIQKVANEKLCSTLLWSQASDTFASFDSDWAELDTSLTELDYEIYKNTMHNPKFQNYEIANSFFTFFQNKYWNDSIIFFNENIDDIINWNIILSEELDYVDEEDTTLLIYYFLLLQDSDHYYLLQSQINKILDKDYLSVINDSEFINFSKSLFNYWLYYNFYTIASSNLQRLFSDDENVLELAWKMALASTQLQIPSKEVIVIYKSKKLDIISFFKEYMEDFENGDIEHDTASNIYWYYWRYLLEIWDEATWNEILSQGYNNLDWLSTQYIAEYVDDKEYSGSCLWFLASIDDTNYYKEKYLSHLIDNQDMEQIIYQVNKDIELLHYIMLTEDWIEKSELHWILLSIVYFLNISFKELYESKSSSNKQESISMNISYIFNSLSELGVYTYFKKDELLVNFTSINQTFSISAYWIKAFLQVIYKESSNKLKEYLNNEDYKSYLQELFELSFVSNNVNYQEDFWSFIYDIIISKKYDLTEDELFDEIESLFGEILMDDNSFLQVNQAWSDKKFLWISSALLSYWLLPFLKNHKSTVPDNLIRKIWEIFTHYNSKYAFDSLLKEFGYDLHENTQWEPIFISKNNDSINSVNMWESSYSIN